jgi:hypothetical protein
MQQPPDQFTPQFQQTPQWQPQQNTVQDSQVFHLAQRAHHQAKSGALPLPAVPVRRYGDALRLRAPATLTPAQRVGALLPARGCVPGTAA